MRRSVYLLTSMHARMHACTAVAQQFVPIANHFPSAKKRRTIVHADRSSQGGDLLFLLLPRPSAGKGRKNAKWKYNYDTIVVLCIIQKYIYKNNKISNQHYYINKNDKNVKLRREISNRENTSVSYNIFVHTLWYVCHFCNHLNENSYYGI